MTLSTEIAENAGVEDLAALLRAARAAEAEGAWDDALAGYDRALALAREGDDPAPVPEILRAVGRVHLGRGDHDAAASAFESALAAAQAAGLRGPVAAALNCLAAVAQARGRLEMAEKLYSLAGATAKEIGDDTLAAMVDQNLGIIAGIRGQLPMALLRYRSALERLRKLGDDRAAACVLNNMGMAHLDLEEWGAAEISFAAGHELADRARDLVTVGRIELNRAELYLRRRQLEPARAAATRAMEVFGRIGSNWGLGEAYRCSGVYYRESGRAEMAEIQLQLALKLAQSTGDALLEAETEREMARVHIQLARKQLALKSLNRAHRLFLQLQARREVADVERRMDRMVETYYQALQLWEVEAAEADPACSRDPQRVADYACRLAEALGFTWRELTWLRIGSLLYDIGKNTVPAAILNKPGKLTPDEWEVVKRHTTAGDELVSDLEFPWDVRPMVRNHHERWDGAGYPDRLRREEIPLSARVLCIADAFDALTSARSWRPAHTREEALAIMAADAGKAFDPNLFRTFRQLVESGRMDFAAAGDA